MEPLRDATIVLLLVGIGRIDKEKLRRSMARILDDDRFVLLAN